MNKMTTSLVQNDELRQNILCTSVEKRLRIVVTHRHDGCWRAYKGQFQMPFERGKAFVALMENDVRSATNGPKPGDTVGVSFRVGHKKCMFSTNLRAVDSAGNECRFHFAWPAQMQQLQRRVYERVAPPPGNVVAVRFWRADTDNQPDKREVKHGQLEDLSAGGMRIKVAGRTDVETDAAYQCVFAPRAGAPPLMLEATLRHREAGDQGRASLGFQFIGFETSTDGQKVLDRLARIVSQFQRSQPRSPSRENAT